MLRDQVRAGRDPFARTETIRESIHGSCSWCGRSNKYGRVGVYHIEHDGGRRETIRGQFCGIGCLNSYHS